MIITLMRQNIGNVRKLIVSRFDPGIFVVTFAWFAAIMLAMVMVLRDIISCSIRSAIFLLIAGPLLLAWYDFDLLRQIVANAGHLSAKDVHKGLTAYFVASVAGGTVLWAFKAGFNDLAHWVNKVIE